MPHTRPAVHRLDEGGTVHLNRASQRDRKIFENLFVLEAGNEKALDDVVRFFEHRAIPLAINHFASLYPSGDYQLELKQIDYLPSRYDDLVIDISTHEYHDWCSSMLSSSANGVRTWERHVDTEYADVPVSASCSLPEQIDVWFEAFRRAGEMCGGSCYRRRVLPREVQYLDALVRGVYAKRELDFGYEFNSATFGDDFYLAIPLRKGQLSRREILNDQKLTEPIKVTEPLTIDRVDGLYAGSKPSAPVPPRPGF